MTDDMHPRPSTRAPLTPTDITAAWLGPVVIAWTWWSTLLHETIYATIGRQPR